MDKPLWIPSKDRVDRANLSRFMRFVREETGNADLNSYAPLYRFSIDQPALFWTLLWDFVGIRGSGERAPVLVDGAEGMISARWFPGVSLNFAQNLLRFDDERVAIRCHGDAGENETLSYAQLQRRVAALSAAMRERGVGVADRVAAVLPNVPDTLVAMLACASLGATWFACPAELDFDEAASLLRRLQPKLLLVAAKVEDYCAGLPDIDTIVAVGGDALPADGADDDQPRTGAETGSRAIALADLVAPFADAELAYTSVSFDHPLYLTCTRAPDGATELLVHSTGGTLIQHMKELVLHADLKREDKIFFHSGNDSMAWYWLASSLAIGPTVVLHTGADLAADDSALWDLVDDYGISVLGLHSHWLDAAARAGLRPRDSHRLLSLKTILAAGAPLSADSYDFVYEAIKKRVLLVPISAVNDTLACFALGAPTLPVWRGEIACRGLGMRVEVLDGQGQAVVGVPGDLTCSAPFPSMPTGFWDDADNRRYADMYFSRQPGLWCCGVRATLTVRESLIV